MHCAGGAAGHAGGEDEVDYAGEDDADPGEQVVSLLKPVTITMILVVYLVHEMGAASQEISSGLSDLMVYQESASDSAGTIAGGVLLNSAVVVAALFVVTTMMMLMYKYRCYRLIYGWLFLSVSSLLFSFGGYVAQSLLVGSSTADRNPNAPDHPPTLLRCTSALLEMEHVLLHIEMERGYLHRQPQCLLRTCPCACAADARHPKWVPHTSYTHTRAHTHTRTHARMHACMHAGDARYPSGCPKLLSEPHQLCRRWHAARILDGVWM